MNRIKRFVLRSILCADVKLAERDGGTADAGRREGVLARSHMHLYFMPRVACFRVLQ